MARKSDSQLLDAGDPFPPLELTLTDDRHMVLPVDLDRPYNAVLVNRGSWCPYCVTQLTGFQAGLTRLAQAGIGVVALSADPREEAAALVAKHGLQFPVAYGASVHGVAQALGVPFSIISGGVGCILAAWIVLKRFPQLWAYDGQIAAQRLSPAATPGNPA